VFTWNPRENKYFLHWFDSMGTTVNTYSGRFDGDVLKVDSVDPEMKSRAFFDLSRPDGYTFKMDVSPDGTQWMTFMEGSYGRRPDAPAHKFSAAPAKTKTKTKSKAKPKAKAKPAKKAKTSAKKGKPAAKKSKKKARKK
jgi:hypothetical protein